MNINEKIERLRGYGFVGHPSVECREYRGELEWFFEGDGPDSVVRCDAPDGLALYADALVDWMGGSGWSLRLIAGGGMDAFAEFSFGDEGLMAADSQAPTRPEAIINAGLAALEAE